MWATPIRLKEEISILYLLFLNLHFRSPLLESESFLILAVRYRFPLNFWFFIHCTTTLSELHIIIINSSFWWNRCIWSLSRHLENIRVRWVHLRSLVNRRSIFMIVDIAVLLELTVTFWYLCLSRVLFGATCLVPDQARHHRKAFLLDLFWCGRCCLVILSWVQPSLTARDFFFHPLESSLSSSWFLKVKKYLQCLEGIRLVLFLKV
jgi:hypothetical protein